jgi:hypothetical protein
VEAHYDWSITKGRGPRCKTFSCRYWIVSAKTRELHGRNQCRLHCQRHLYVLSQESTSQSKGCSPIVEFRPLPSSRKNYTQSTCIQHQRAACQHECRSARDFARSYGPPFMTSVVADLTFVHVSPVSIASNLCSFDCCVQLSVRHIMTPQLDPRCISSITSRRIQNVAVLELLDHSRVVTMCNPSLRSVETCGSFWPSSSSSRSVR